MKLVISSVGNNYNINYRAGCSGLFNNIFYNAVKEKKCMYWMPLW